MLNHAFSRLCYNTQRFRTLSRKIIQGDSYRRGLRGTIEHSHDDFQIRPQAWVHHHQSQNSLTTSIPVGNDRPEVCVSRIEHGLVTHLLNIKLENNFIEWVTSL